MQNFHKLIDIIRLAGKKTLEIYNKNFSVELKNDNSPLTAADKASNQIIKQGLRQNFPNIPIISEEEKQIDYKIRKNWKTFFLIDPLDGTKEFIKKNGEFTINIAIIENNRAKAGIVFSPVTDELYYCQDVKKNSFKITSKGKKKKLRRGTHYSEQQKVRIVSSRSHISPEVEKFADNLKKTGKQIELKNIGSSLKICYVAENKADVYPRFGPTMEWDTAAAHAIAQSAGRRIKIWQSNQDLTYNKQNLKNPFFIVE